MELSSIGAIKQCTICGLGAAILPRIAHRTRETNRVGMGRACI
ncbi:MAG: hypothetical protein K0R22_1928 [Sporomusa sp.]|nr:hypothetical protein [Sporomusa sp.]